jgi:hypothetical protein
MVSILLTCLATLVSYTSIQIQIVMNAKNNAESSNIYPKKRSSLAEKAGVSDENAARWLSLRRMILKKTAGTYREKHRRAKHEKKDENGHRWRVGRRIEIAVPENKQEAPKGESNAETGVRKQNASPESSVIDWCNAQLSTQARISHKFPSSPTG